MKYLSSELSRFSSQIKYATENYNLHDLKLTDFAQVLISGLGGSGIAGKIVKGYFQNKFLLPIDVISDYVLPAYVNERTLVIVSSYSGNTEESLAMYEDARAKNCTIIVLSTGGKLVEWAKRDKVLIYFAESEFPPRMALGYSLTYLFLIFFELLQELDNVNFLDLVNTLSDFNSFKKRAKLLADFFTETIKQKFVLIVDTLYEPVAIRFAQQINENAKLEAFVTVLPETNHNVIESYYGKTGSNFIFLNSRENIRITRRFLFVKDLLHKNHESFQEILIEEGKCLKTLFETIYLLDWYSLYLADINGSISNRVDNIVQLKSYLSV